MYAQATESMREGLTERACNIVHDEQRANDKVCAHGDDLLSTSYWLVTSRCNH